VNIQWKV